MFVRSLSHVLISPVTLFGDPASERLKSIYEAQSAANFVDYQSGKRFLADQLEPSIYEKVTKLIVGGTWPRDKKVPHHLVIPAALSSDMPLENPFTNVDMSCCFAPVALYWDRNEAGQIFASAYTTSPDGISWKDVQTIEQGMGVVPDVCSGCGAVIPHPDTKEDENKAKEEVQRGEPKLGLWFSTCDEATSLVLKPGYGCLNCPGGTPRSPGGAAHFLQDFGTKLFLPVSAAPKVGKAK